MEQRTNLIALAAGMFLAAAAAPLVARADPPQRQARPAGWLEALAQRDSLTDGWFGAGEKLEDKGISLALGVTQIYQLNLEGGLATHRRAGRYAGSYDLEGLFDLERLLGLRGATVRVLAEGSWSEGIDASSVGSILGLNDDAGGDRSIDVTELWYEQQLLEGKLRFRLGKIDLTGGFLCRHCPVAFDGSAYANDETAQFLGSALVNNPTIPFPDNGLAVVAYAEPADGFYVSVAAADAQADARETGLRTAFHDEDHFFAIFETGVAPNFGGLTGGYRLGLWYDPQPKDGFAGGRKRDDTGFYLSCDQLVLKENADPADTQGLGLFCRFGCADDDVNEVHKFWSIGGQYQGLIPGRNSDVLALGVAQGLLSRHRDDEGRPAPQETVIEAYYSITVTGWLNLSPVVQYVDNPGGRRDVDDAVVVGIRAQMNF